MRNALLTLALLALSSLGAASSAQAVSDRVSGVWQRSDGLAKVRIAPCGTAVCATNTWIKDPNSGEKVGDRLVMQVKPHSSGDLKGTAYDPQRKLTYAITISVGPERLTTKGCVLGGLLCKAVGWARLD
jgi:uncharacterized protein (DUF2147 family)